MTMNKIAIIALIVLAPVSTSALAQPVDNYAVTAIADARYASAVARLEAKVKSMPNDETAWINLAIAYRHTGRSDDAVAAYTRVLKLDNVELDTATGQPMWSHDVARAGLAMPRNQVVASARN